MVVTRESHMLGPQLCALPNNKRSGPRGRRHFCLPPVNVRIYLGGVAEAYMSVNMNRRCRMKYSSVRPQTRRASSASLQITAETHDPALLESDVENW